MSGCLRGAFFLVLAAGLFAMFQAWRDQPAVPATPQSAVSSLPPRPAALNGWLQAPPSGTRTTTYYATPVIALRTGTRLAVICAEGDIFGVVVEGLNESGVRETVASTTASLDTGGQLAVRLVGAGLSREWVARFAGHAEERRVGRALLNAHAIDWTSEIDIGLGDARWSLDQTTEGVRASIVANCGA